jgi:PAS domain-containing protein
MESKSSDSIINSGFLNIVNNSLCDAVCVVNQNIEVVYYNSVFDELFGGSGDELFGKRFGSSIGCRGHEESYPDGICNRCKLRLSMLATIATESNQEQQSMVLQMSQGSKEEYRLIRFKSNYMEYESRKYAVVLIQDLTDMGNETLEFINRFYEER